MSNTYKYIAESLGFQIVPVVSVASVTSAWKLGDSIWHPITVLGNSNLDVWPEHCFRSKRMEPYLWVLWLKVQVSENLKCSEKICVLNTFKLLKIIFI